MKVEDEGMWQLPANISLQALEIVYYPGHGIRGFPGEALACLTNLIITRCSLTSLHLASPCLLDISIDKCDELMSIELDQILSLRSLKIKDCKQLLSLHIEAHLFAGLEEIEIEDCPELTMRLLNIQDNKLSMSSFKSIFVKKCKWEISLQFVELTSLQYCGLSDTVGLQSLHIPSSHLQRITLSGCVGLTSVEVEDAIDIRIFHCFELNNVRIAQPATIQTLRIISPFLLDWGSISNLYECSCLTEIELGGVDGGFIERLLLSSPSPSLKEGESSNFKSIGSLIVALPSLIKVTSVELESPIAHTDGYVFISWCTQLKNVRIPSPIALQKLDIIYCSELSLNTGVDWDSLPDLNDLKLRPLPPPEKLPKCLLQRQALVHLRIVICVSYDLIIS